MTKLYTDARGKTADACSPCSKGNCSVNITSAEIRADGKGSVLMEVACAADIHFVVDNNNPAITVDTTCQFQAAGTRTWVLSNGMTHFRSTGNATVTVLK